MAQTHRQRLVIKPTILAAPERQEFLLLKSAIVRQAALIKNLKDALKGQKLLVHNIAHEFKNPLTVICGYTTLLLDNAAALPPETGAQLRAMERNLNHFSALLEELLESARLEAGKVELARGDIPAETLAQEALSDMRFEALKKEIDLSLDNQETAGLKVYADAGRARQILLNLLTNAIKFTPAGGAILIRLKSADGCVRFCVKDTGVGIPASALPRLFERFYQAKQGKSAASAPPGLGLGLNICKNLVELHGGKIWAESVIGQGASFYFTLPLACAKDGSKRRDDTIQPLAFAPKVQRAGLTIKPGAV